MKLAYAVLIGVCALSPLKVTAQADATAERPAVSVGDKWQYAVVDGLTGAQRSSSFTVDEVMPDAIVGGSGRTKHTFTRDWNELRSDNGQESKIFQPSRSIFEFPLQVGKHWEGAFVESGKKQRRWFSKAVVEKIETITVPAGTFTAFKVRIESFHDSGKVGKQTRVVDKYWYAPEVKRWVKRERQSVNFKSAHNMQVSMAADELVSFRLAQ